MSKFFPIGRLFLAGIVLCLAGCNHYFYYVKLPPENLLDTHPFIKIDSSYQLYVRKGYRIEHGKDKRLKMSKSPLLSDSSTLIEVEYLLISSKQKNAIYFSTMPDKYQTFYQKNYLGDGYINCWDFKTILFARMEKNDLLNFIAKGRRDVSVKWKMEEEKGDIVIDNIQESENQIFQIQIPARQALEEPILFRHVGAFNIVFHNPDNPINVRVIPLADGQIHYELSNGKYKLYFRFSGDVSDGYNTIYFSSKRIPYKPDSLRTK